MNMIFKCFLPLAVINVVSSKVKYFTLVEESLGEDVLPLYLFPGRCLCSAEHLYFRNELDYREIGELLFLKVINQ